MTNYIDILTEFLEQGVLSKLIEHGYALTPAKSAGYLEGKRDSTFFIDMSLRTHIVNGLFAVSRLLTYLSQVNIYQMNEEDFRRLLAYFTTHDFHKDISANKDKRGEFDISLDQIQRHIEVLGISDFVDTNAAEHRVTMIHLPSPKVGDYSEARSNTSQLTTWVRIADAMSSIQQARDCGSIVNYLRKKLAREYTQRPLAFYWHEVDESRGITTMLLHESVASILAAKYGLFPLLYFANGTLYIGEQHTFQNDEKHLQAEVAAEFFSLVQSTLGDRALEVAQDAIRAPQGTVQFAADAYIFAGLKQQVEALRNYAQRRKAKHFLTDRLGSRMEGRANRAKQPISQEEIQQHISDFCEKYGIAETAELDEDFSTKWFATTTFIMGTESLASALLGTESEGWLFEQFLTPQSIQKAIIENKSKLTVGGLADHAVIIAYHYLQNQIFGHERTVQTADLPLIFDTLQHNTFSVLQPHDQPKQRLAYVNAEFGLQEDIEQYLAENLRFSFTQERSISSPIALIAKERTGGHSRVCSFCNREIPTSMKSKNRTITMAGIVTTTFSNRLRPNSDTAAPMQVWCPMCYLEFVMRERLGLGFGRGYSKADSRRLYLFLLPDYSFTPEFWTYSEKILRPFRDSTRLKLRRDFGDEPNEPTIPKTWLQYQQVDEYWLTLVEDMFRKTAEKMAEINEKLGIPQREMAGEKSRTSNIESPHFRLMPYEISSRDKKFAATDSEIWVKAVYNAILIHLLLGVRVYVTDKPYLPLTRPDEMKHIIELDGVHPLLRRTLLRQSSNHQLQGSVIALADLKETLDLFSATWEINAALSGGRGNRDKQIASVLEKVNLEPLAGAYFYKRWQSETGYDLYPELRIACKIILDCIGGEKLSLAQELTDASLRLFSPNRGNTQQGRAHRYETIFRTAVEVIKSSPQSVKDIELQERVAGKLLKRLSRLSGGYIPLVGQEQVEAATTFAEIVVQKLFAERCRGSKAQLTHEENALADAIYYLTDQHNIQRIQAAKAKKEQEKNNVPG